MARQLGEPPVAGERRELVDRAPRHVHRHEVGPRPGEPRRRQRLDPLRQALLGPHSRHDVVARGLEEARQGPRVERLLVEPAGEEGGDLGVVVRLEDARHRRLESLLRFPQREAHDAATARVLPGTDAYQPGGALSQLGHPRH